MFCDQTLAARIEAAEVDLLLAAGAHVRRRVPEAVGLPIGGGLASLTEPGSPLNKVAGLGFAPFDAAAWPPILAEHARRGMPVQVELSTLADPALGAFFTALGHVVEDEGFRVRSDKTRVLRAHGRQRICGVVVNQGVGLARTDLKALEAILFNASRTSVEAQNRADHPRFFDHLQGRVAHAAFVDPSGARRILELWSRVSSEATRLP